ncbi:hypothetical protein [Mycolicibacterium sp. CBMA 226]|uniref:hypothetical protein n=1 Tax=Mycolicibacterium sp. CBMA 226 TaxID=2606611 RepID=UPI0012DE339F|nr:hypothetical protein [Mycolicibacterium sp. CBMA 226]MUL77523.1 hypothetical protein [Mycolicibacterium sp. CBMA 226]
MHTLTTRLSLPTATALMAASVFTATPPPPALTALQAPPVIHSVQMPDIQLTATVADILQFPAFKQWVVNQITDVVTIGTGLVKAAQGIQQTISAIPGLVVTVTQQVLARDLVGALGTVEEGLVGSVTAIGGPILVSIIARDQRALAVDQAMVQAVPVALIGLGTGLLGGFNDFATAAITAGQNVVAALLPINIGNLVNAVADSIKLVVQGLNTGVGKVIDGIVFAQNTIAKALATQPAAAVAAVAATTPAPTAGVAATAVPKIAAATIKPAVKPVPTAATPTTMGTKDPTGTKGPTAPATGTTPDTTGTTATSTTGSGKSDTGSKTAKKTTPTRPKTNAGNSTREQKAA